MRGPGVCAKSFGLGSMHDLKTFWCAMLLGMSVATGAAAAAAAPAEPPAAVPAVAEHAAAAQHEGLPAAAVDLVKIGPLTITNSMVVSWFVAVALIVFAQIAMRNVREIPAGAQNFWEWMVESLHEFLDGIIGHELVHKTFWFFATVFIFILFSNWFGLIPGA